MRTKKIKMWYFCYFLCDSIIMQWFKKAAAISLKITDEFWMRNEYRQSCDVLFDIIRQLGKRKSFSFRWNETSINDFSFISFKLKKKNVFSMIFSKEEY